jgi:peptide subunit release factor 1 (eRF1)
VFLVPPNGLVIYCGTIVTEEGKEKKVNIDFEPFKPINTSLYLCDNKVSQLKANNLWNVSTTFCL